MTLSATAEAVGTTAAPLQRRTRAQQACEARAAYCSCGCSPATSRGKPMVIEAHRVVQQVVDGLRATRSTIGQRLVAKGWSANLTTQHTWAAEWSRSSTATAALSCFRFSSGGRVSSFAARSTLHSMSAVASRPLSSCARPPEGWRTRGWPRQYHLFRRPKFVSEIVRKRVKSETRALQKKTPRGARRQHTYTSRSVYIPTTGTIEPH